MRFPFRVFVLFCLPGVLAAQGPLTPPGAPAPTMKSRDQIHSEAAAAKVAADAAKTAAEALADGTIPVNATNTPGDATSLYIIDQPGSYILTGPITATGQAAITIKANDVSLDLRGHTVSGSGETTIKSTPAFNGLILRNGIVRSSNKAAIDCSWISDGQYQDLTVFGASLLNDFGSGTIITNCTFRGLGVRAAGGSLLENVSVFDALDFGIILTFNGIARNCSVNTSLNSGILLGQGASAIDCSVSSSPTGITASNANAMIDGCSINSCPTGISITAPGAVVRDTQINVSTTNAISVTSNGVSIRNTQIVNATTTGINAPTATALNVEGCSIKYCGGDAVNVGDNARVVDNHISNNGTVGSTGAGIRITGDNCHVDGNTLANNDIGITDLGTGSLITRNTSTGTASDFVASAGSNIAAIVANPASGFASTNPWANFTD